MRLTLLIVPSMLAVVLGCESERGVSKAPSSAGGEAGTLQDSAGAPASLGGAAGAPEDRGGGSPASAGAALGGGDGPAGGDGNGGVGDGAGGEGAGGAVNDDVGRFAWATWPMPNCPGDVAAGAPNPQSYKDNDDGTVSDNLTGLMWQRSAAPEMYSWSNAHSYCSNLTLAEHADWRLPSRIELVSIIDDSVTEQAGDSVAFPGTPGGYFWTSSRLAGSKEDAWAVVFNGGAYVVLTSDSSNVRCVRSAPEQGERYAASEATVTDNQTKLTWQRQVSSAAYSWEEAKSVCASFGAGFRLPTVKELQTLVDESRLNPAIDTLAFPDTPAGAFWSSSALAGSPGYAWNVYFYNGGTYSFFTDSAFFVRCVR